MHPLLTTFGNLPFAGSLPEPSDCNLGGGGYFGFFFGGGEVPIFSFYGRGDFSDFWWDGSMTWDANGCANSMGTWKNCLLSAGKPMSIEFLV